MLRWYSWLAPPSHQEMASQENCGGGSCQHPCHFLLHVHPNSHPHPIRPNSVFPLLLANLHNCSLPFSENPIAVMVVPSQRPVTLLILSNTLTTKFALELLHHDKHVQTERKDTLFNRESEGVGAKCRQGSTELHHPGPTGT